MILTEDLENGENMTNFEQLLEHINREHVYIQPHNFPDADAVASAYGLQKLLEYKGISSTICYMGRIDRYSIDRLREEMGIELCHAEEFNGTMQADDEVILVDSQKGNSNIADIIGEEIICIDHHPKNDICEYRFEDIRPEVGACSTIIAQYFYENHIIMDNKVATALTFGIKMDTDGFSRGISKLDLEMVYRMYDKCDQDLIHILNNSNLYFEDLLAYSTAIKSIKVYGHISFADAGADCPEALIASVSDFMLALVEVIFSVVYSQKTGGIKISVRSEMPELDAGNVIAEALAGIGNGGGHAAMAGGFIRFEGSKEEGHMLMETVKERFLAVIGEKDRAML